MTQNKKICIKFVLRMNLMPSLLLNKIKPIENRDLHKLFANGEEQAIAKVYNMYGTDLFGICLRYAKNREEAEDLLQDGFIHIMQKAKLFKGESSLKTWMYRVMVNYCLTYLRKNIKHIPSENIEHFSEKELDDDGSFFDEISSELIFTSMQKLPNHYRLTLNLFAIEGKSHKEIGEILNITSVASRCQLKRAKEMLKELVEKGMKRK